MLQLSFFMFSFREHKSEFLLLVLSLAPRGLSPGTPVFPSPEEPTLRNFNSMWNAGLSEREHKSEFLLLVLSLAPRGLSPGTPVFPSPEEPTLRNAGTSINEFLRTPKCYVGKQITNFQLQIRSCLNDSS